MDNFEINEDRVIVSVNPKVYPLDVIYSAAYIFTDNNYIILDGNPEEEILVQIKPKEKTDSMEKIANEFYNELINYGAYAAQAIKNAHLRGLIIRRVLQTSESHTVTHSQTSNLSSDSKPWKKEEK